MKRKTFLRRAGLVALPVLALISSAAAQTEEPQSPLFRSAGDRIASASFSPPSVDKAMGKSPESVKKQIGSNLKNEIMIWGGYSPDSTTALPTATTPDARFGVVGVTYARRFNNSDTVNLKFTAGVYPVMVLNYPDGGGRKTAAAFGVNPFGIQMNFRPRKKVQPFVGMSGGFIRFSKSVPNEFGTKFNFTADFTGGIEFRTSEKRSVSVGYKLFHISNGQRGRINPSYDNNVIFAGYTFLF